MLTLEGYLRQLGENDTPLTHGGLTQLSGLSADEVAAVAGPWAAIPAERRREVVGRLVALSEDNSDLDFSAVFRACLGDHDPDVRQEAIRGLWEYDDRVILPPLLELVRHDPHPGVRCAAAIALGKFGALALDGKLIQRDCDRVKETLLSTISDNGEDMEVRRRATEAVAAFECPEVERVILWAYRSGDSSLKQSAIFAMGRTSDPRWLPHLFDDLSDDDPAVRYEAVNACGDLGDESAVPHLIGMLDDDDANVELAVVRALAAIGGPLAKQALVCVAQGGEGDLEEAAREALDEDDLGEDPSGFRFGV